MKLETLNGNLCDYLNVYCCINKFVESELITTSYSEYSHLKRIKKLIVECRKHKYHWCYTYEDIRFSEDTYNGKSEKIYYYLPSIDLSDFFNIDDNHNQLKDFFQEHKYYDSDIIWDTESSAWYPKFKNFNAAKNCIDFLDKLFDDFYLKPLK